MAEPQREVQTRPTALVIGQVPPPYHGQAVMIAAFVNRPNEAVEVEFNEMRYSDTVEEVGRLRLSKVGELFRVLYRSVSTLIRGRADVVYYPPAGAGRTPMIRDILTLLVLRRFGRPLAFHFHAMGLEASYDSLWWPWRPLFRLAYFRPDVCICPAQTNLAEVAFLQPRATRVVAYGIPDDPGARRDGPAVVDGTATVLFVGNLIESKGIGRMLGLASALGASGVDARVVLVGAPPSEADMQAFLAHPAVKDGHAEFVGPLYGEDKLARLRTADVFCFPSKYESENFPVVLIEALRSGLPVVTSDWRGIPEIVADGVSGYIVDPDDEVMLVERVQQLLADDALRESMGRAARDRYERHFTEDRYVESIGLALKDAVNARSE